MESFEDNLVLIDQEIYKRKNKVHLYLNDCDFDDLSQVIRLHIYKKWHMRDSSKPLTNWVNRIISNQITNYIRNNYGCLAPPCVKCPMNQGGNLCSYTVSKVQCSECPLFKSWEKKKKIGYNLKFATSLNEVFEDADEDLSDKLSPEYEAIDWDRVLKRLSFKMKERLPLELYLVYKFLYVNGGTELDLANKLGFKTSEKNRNPGYKQIYNLKQKIIEEARFIISNEDIL